MNNLPTLTMEVDMSVASDILNTLTELKIDCIQVALNSAQLFGLCKSAGDAQDIAKNLSKLFLEGKLIRDKPQGGIYKYWLPAPISNAEIKALPSQQQIDDYLIPAFLKAQPDDLAVADRVDEKLGADAFIQSNKIVIKTREAFKIALTNNGTLMLFDINEQVIELDLEQTKLLADFFNDLDLKGFISKI